MSRGTSTTSDFSGLPRAPWRTAFILSGVLFALFFLVFDPAFQVNDDLAIALSLNGFFYGAPDYHTVLLGALLARPLAWLHASAPAIPWYGVAVYGLHFATVAVWLGLFLQRRRSSADWLPFAFTLLFFELAMMLEVTYSAAALAVGGVGILLHFEYAREGRAALAASFLAGSMVGIAFLTRQDVVPGLAMAAVPLGLWRGREIPVRRHLAAMGAFLVLAGSGWAVHEATYSSPEWTHFREHFALRFQLHGTPRLSGGPGSIALANEVGWSANDLALFRRYVYAAPDLYDVEALSALVDATAGIGYARSPLPAFSKRVLAKYPFEVMALLACGLLLCPRMNAKNRRIGIALVCSYFVGALYLATFLRFPPRLAQPLAFTVLAWFVMAPLPQEPRCFASRPAWMKGRVAGAIVVLCLIVAPLARLVVVSLDHGRQRAAFLATLETVASWAPKPMLISLGSALPWEALSPFTTRDDLPDLDYIGLGWRTHAPPFREHLRTLDVGDVYLVPLERDDVFIAGRDDVIVLYETFVREHYGIDPALALRLSYGKRMRRGIYGRSGEPNR